jgi:uncharacterized protein with ParB-like and HNH nuclease domain
MSAINLTDLFKTKIFRIPDYQRGYAWEKKQLCELWDDIDEIAFSNGEFKKHYTGTIYLEETSPTEAEKWFSATKFYNVVDGQQRLTTISILLFELLKATKIGYAEKKREKLVETFICESNISGESMVYKFSYSPSDQNYNFLLHTIFENKKIVLNQKQQNHYTRNLSEAKKFFSDNISLLNGEQKNILFKKITTSLQFDIREIEKDIDVQAVFETMNNRGKPLSVLEKLKNRLIYLTDKLNNPDEDKIHLRKKINDAWGKIYTCLAQNPEQILDEDVFLSAHLSLYRKPKESVFSEKAAEIKVFQMFCNKPNKYPLEEDNDNEENEEPISFKKIDDYIIKLSELAPIWYEIHNSKSKLIKKILTLNNSKDVKIFLCSIQNKTKDKNKLEETFSNLEKILFRNRIPGIGIIDERTAASWARDIYTDKDTIQAINQKQTDLINIAIIIPNLIQSFNSLFAYERGAKGFHRWSNLKYFLFEYEEFLKKEAKEINEKVTIDDFEETTIEHIMPQQFEDNWNNIIQAVVKPLTDEEKIAQVHKVLINTLGNLTILKNGKNSSLGNQGWINKKERFRTGSYNEIAISHYKSWTEKDIAKRGTEMLRFLETKVHGLIFSEKDIEKILFNDDYIIKLVYGRSPAANTHAYERLATDIGLTSSTFENQQNQ